VPPTATYTFTNTPVPPTATNTFTNTFTPTVTFSSTPGTTQQIVQIFDSRGELVRSLTGTNDYPNPSELTLSLSSFIPASSGAGGSVTISLNHQTVTVWDVRDDQGQWVPNGVYKIVVEEEAGGQNYYYSENVSVEPFFEPGGVNFKAAPNFAHSGDMVHFSVSYETAPADSRSRIKIYSLSGELLRNLPVANGQAVWNLENNGGLEIASGLYFALLDGVDVTTGLPVQKIDKILFLH
jgi:hypothetical protein